MIDSIENLEFLPRNNNPIGQSNCYLCIICAQMMVARYGTWLIGDAEIIMHERLIMTVNSAEAFQFYIAKEDKCAFC